MLESAVQVAKAGTTSKRPSVDIIARLTPMSGVTPVAAPDGIAISSTNAAEDRRQRALRTIVYLMFFRVGLVTLLLASVVVVALTQGSPERLAGPFGRFVFALIAGTFLLSVVYGLYLRRVRNPMRFAYVQIGFDLIVISTLVHATGGAQSAFHFLYLIDVVAVALLPTRNSALMIALASAVCLIGASLGGYLEWLPLAPGQEVFPWDMSQRELAFRLVLSLGAVTGVGALGFALSRQSREAGLRLERHERFAGDLASLHENIIRCLSSGLVTTTPEGITTSINEAAGEILGVSREHALRAPLALRIPDLAPILAEAGPVGVVRRQEVDAVRPDGRIRRLGISATPLTDHTGAVIGRVIHFQDLTDLRRMEAQVQRAERLAGIGRLAAGIAHEIRNPLASISGSVETLRVMRGADDDSNVLAQIVVREVDRLNDLITALLDYARPSNQEQRPINVSQIVADVVQSFAQGNPRSKVIAHIEPGVAMNGTPTGIQQVLWNLLRNADEAMPSNRQGNETNEIRVTLSSHQQRQGRREVRLVVADNGSGIPEEHQDQVFEPFFTQGKASGTGLGLAMVARIVEEHRGSIDLDSTVGKGTAMDLRFPAVDASLVRPLSPSAVPAPLLPQ